LLKFHSGTSKPRVTWIPSLLDGQDGNHFRRKCSFLSPAGEFPGRQIALAASKLGDPSSVEYRTFRADQEEYEVGSDGLKAVDRGVDSIHPA